jgi:glutamyl-tRNA synthetase
LTAPRVRFAPSPTGQLHVGNARTALFNWLLARRNGGTLVLRIEDTDRERSSAASEQAILEDLRWLGLAWEEGPDVGGPHGPYRQSERQARYQAAADRLSADRRAYRCFCTPDELEAERQAALAAGQAPRYSGRCRSLDPVAVASRLDAGEPAATRFAIPAPMRDVTFTDIVRGPVTVSTATIGDPVIVRSDGSPAYNFAVVIDDAAMAITHVVRGEDHISNTPRQILLYEALGLRPPLFAHLSLVLGSDHAPLSKRHGATSVAEFRARGYLPEALANYLALLGWSPGEGEEMLPLDEMARRFDLSRVTHSAAVFDVPKLAWMNREYMKSTPVERLVDRGWGYFAGAAQVTSATAEARGYLAEALLPMAIGAVDRLEELPERVAFIFNWRPDEAASRVMAEPEGPLAIRAFADVLSGTGPLVSREAFRAAATRAREVTGLKGKALFHPIRVAMTAADSGPELDLAVPAIDRGAALSPSAGVAPIVSCAVRARQVAERLR